MLRKKWPDFLLLILIGYLFIAQIHAIWPFTIDDMYITLRYSRHWYSGEGLLWNIHELPVEGYSNFSFMILATVALKLKLDPVIVLKSCGVIGLFFTCCFVYAITRTWFRSRQALLPVVALLAYKGQIIWTASGLETAVYEALICGGLYFLWRGIGFKLFPAKRGESCCKALCIAALFFIAAGLTRPEAPILVIIFYVCAYIDLPSQKAPQQYRFLLVSGLLFTLGYSAYFFWRWFYFGYFFPNPVYCKGIVAGHRGELVIQYGQLILPLVPLLIPACIYATDKRHYFLWTPSLAYCLLLWRADPIVAFDNRLFLPAFVLLLPLMLKGVLWYVTCMCDVLHKRFWLAVDGLFLSVVLLFIPKMTLADYQYFSENPKRGEALRLQVIAWLEKNARLEDQIVLADSGMIPYYSPNHFIDSYCLNNRSLAHDYSPPSYVNFCKKILKDKPAIIILTALALQDELIYTPADECLKSLLVRNKDYTFIKSLHTPINSHQSYMYQIYRLSR